MNERLTWLIVGGCPRSGTTALGNELAKSLSISLFHEISTHTMFNAVRSFFGEEARHRGYASTFDLYSDKMPIEERDAARIAAGAFRAVTGRKTPIIGTKLPAHYHQPRPLGLPGVSVRELMIVRDPFSTVLSYMRKLASEGSMSPEASFGLALRDWVSAWNYCIANRDDPCLMTVVYEIVQTSPRHKRSR